MKPVRSLGSALAIGLLTFALDCAQSATQTAMRSLERSGKVSFLCIADPTSPTPGRPLEYCHPTPGVKLGTGDYSLPHVIALVTQTARGEVAAIDLTSGTVLDQDLSAPAYSFIPVGQAPTGIVTTSASSAAFVSVADPARPGIFALPASRVLPGSLPTVPMLTSFPACALPALPGAMTVVSDPLTDPADPGSARTHCPNGLRADAPVSSAPTFSLAAELHTTGTPKLVVAFPALGELAVIDAQDVLDLPPGGFEPCPIELRVPLGGAAELGIATSATNGTGQGAASAVADADAGAGSATIPGSDAGDAASTQAQGDAGSPSTGAPVTGPLVCSTPPSPGYAPVLPGTRAWPSAMTLSDDGRLFVADQSLPVVHVLRAASPCALAEMAPLVATSSVDPGRTIITSAVAVSPLTSTGNRYLYAVDLLNGGSLMVFDVSNGAESRTPLRLFDPMYVASREPDRLTYTSPVQAVTFARHDVPLTVTNNPLFPGGVITGRVCDPTLSPVDPYSPQASTSASTSFGASTTAPASAGSLRGIFGFAALSNGQVGVIDVDDLDAPCRRPKASSDVRLGCPGDDIGPELPGASDEVTCRVVQSNLPRAGQLFSNTASGNRSPTMQTLPLLRNREGGVLLVDDSSGGSGRPRLLGPKTEPATFRKYVTQVGGATTETLSHCAFVGREYGKDCERSEQLATVNWVAFDVREPRVHADQTWDIRFEGQLPGFSGHLGTLQCADPSRRPQTSTDPDTCETEGAGDTGYILRDSSASFCKSGVEEGTRRDFRDGDILEITQPLPDSGDPYWATKGDLCNYERCTTAYGTPSSPRASRERYILEAYEDRVVLARPFVQASDGRGPLPLSCCFPYPVTYTVRGNQQWIVVGSATGFLHRVAPDPASLEPSTARCKKLDPTCDPSLMLRNGRVVMATAEDAKAGLLTYDAPPGSKVFRNPQMQFVIWRPVDESVCGDRCFQRDMNFSFQETGGFKTMAVTLSSTALVLPQDIVFLPTLRRLAVPDATSAGLLLIDLDKVVVTESYM